MATAPKISNLPAAPNRQQPANFSAKGDALLSSLQGFATEANALGDYVEGAAGQVAIDKAAVDANVPLLNDAKAAAPLALSYRDTAKTYRDAAAASEAKALQHKNDVASAVVYQNLASVALSKSITMVDGCIDTSPNPSLAVQRRTSWYNETLGTTVRGTRRELPTRKVVIAEANKVTIYDGDDPALPMWMVFEGGTTVNRMVRASYVQKVAFKDGVLVVGHGSTFGLSVIPFISEDHRLYATSQAFNLPLNIAQRNVSVSFIPLGGRGIAGDAITGVDVGIIAGAPVDPVSWLQKPTVWAFTSGGVTQIGWDGNKESIWNLTHSDTATTLGGEFNGDGTFTYNANGFLHRRPVLQSDKILSVRYTKQVDDVVFVPYISGPQTTSYVNPTAHMPYGGSHIIQSGDLIASALGLTYIKPEYSNAISGLYANITASYNTGLLNSKCNGVYMSSTDASNLSERIIRSDFTGTGNLDGWTMEATATNQNGVDSLRLLSGPGTNLLASFSLTGLTVGANYSVGFQRKAGFSASALIVAGFSSSYESTANFRTFNFVATQPTHTVAFYASNSNLEAALDYLEVNRSDEDRSNIRSGPSVVGLVQRVPVAEGAELMGYTGFNPSNRLQRFAGDDFAYGTADFHFCGWVKFGNQAGFGALVHVTSGVGPNDPETVLSIYSGGSGFYARTKTQGVTLTEAHIVNKWRKIDLLRRNGVLYGYVDGVVVGSAVCPDDLTDANSTAYFGTYKITEGGFNAAATTVFALARNTKGQAPSSEQVLGAYLEELPMFQPNSKATLKGDVSSVIAVHHDKDSGLFYAGTPAGRSEFSGLVRVGQSDTPINTKLVARDGMILEQ